MSVLIPTSGIHNDPDVYLEIFDPMRFTEELITSRDPFTYLPYGRGPRYCIDEQILRKNAL